MHPLDAPDEKAFDKKNDPVGTPAVGVGYNVEKEIDAHYTVSQFDARYTSNGGY